MNILLYNFGSYTHADLLYFLKKAGHKCKVINYRFRNQEEDSYFERYFLSYIKESSFDCVMSTNFFPLIAKLCYHNNIKYLAWSYDSPISRKHLEHYKYPTNYVFLFDREEVQYFRNQGLDNFYHLPLAVNVKRLQTVSISPEDYSKYSCDISFIGQFYQSPLKDLLSAQDDYTKGYINALVDTQQKVYGYNFISECIPNTLIEKMNQNFASIGLPVHEENGEPLSKSGLVHSIDKQITRTERIVLIKMLSQFHHLRLYTTESIDLLKDIPCGGTAHYFTEMPKIFRLSKINLNPTLKSIHSGIPLRALDIMGSSGFLLSNFQPELAEFFRPDIDVVMYDSIEDAICKADYYLKHEDKRLNIIQNALTIIENHFDYPSRIHDMFTVAHLL